MYINITRGIIHASHMLATYIAKIYLTYFWIDSMASERQAIYVIPTNIFLKYLQESMTQK